MKDRLISEHRFVEDLYGCLDGFDFDLDDVVDVLRGVESVDAVQVVHGHWTTIKASLEITCSICNHGVMYDGRNDYRYCSHCGAKMDELLQKTQQVNEGEQDDKG